MTDICTMKCCTDKNVIFNFFTWHDLIPPHTKFHVYQTPPSCFLLIYDPFLTNIWRKYFSCNHFTVLHQLKLKWSNLDQNWAKTQPLLFKILKSLIVLWGCIVQCVTRPKIWPRPVPGHFFGTKFSPRRFRDFFRYQIFSETGSETFFGTKFSSRPIPRLFSVLNFSETDSGTFSGTKFFSRPVPLPSKKYKSPGNRTRPIPLPVLTPNFWQEIYR